MLLAEGTDDLFELSYRKLIVATGAREILSPFPGWRRCRTSGGLQAMVKSGLPIAAKRVLVAGAAPLASGGGSGKHGAEIPMICEQVPGVF